MKTKVIVKVFKSNGRLLKKTTCKNFSDMEDKFPKDEVNAGMEKGYKYVMESNFK